MKVALDAAQKDIKDTNTQVCAVKTLTEEIKQAHTTQTADIINKLTATTATIIALEEETKTEIGKVAKTTLLIVDALGAEKKVVD